MAAESGGRTIAIGDIHGCLTAYDSLLELLQPTPGDHVILLGDLVDRGPDTRGVIARTRELQRVCRLDYLMGNHEDMLIRAIAHGENVAPWLQCGGLQVLSSYGLTIRKFDDFPREDLDFLCQASYYIETPTHLFVHASLLPQLPMSEQSIMSLRWEKLRGDEELHSSGKQYICGHTAQKSGLPRIFPGGACIDTFAYGGGWLTAMDVGTGMFLQANQLRQTRRLNPSLEIV